MKDASGTGTAASADAAGCVDDGAGGSAQPQTNAATSDINDRLNMDAHLCRGCRHGARKKAQQN